MATSFRKNTWSIVIICLLTVLFIAFGIKATYSTFITRQKINEGFLLVSTIQNALNEYAIQHAGFPINDEMDNTAFGLPKPLEMKGTYISSINVSKAAHSDHVILIAKINPQVIPGLEDGHDNPLYNPHLQFNGHFNGSKIIWYCSSNLATRYLPEYCQGS